MVLEKGDRFNFEAAVDLKSREFDIAEVMEEIGFLRITVQYNDGENGIREHQLGWRPGDTWDINNFGKVYFGAKKSSGPDSPLDRFYAREIGQQRGKIAGYYKGREPLTLAYSSESDYGAKLRSWRQTALPDSSGVCVLEDLKPETRYYYRIFSETLVSSPMVFKTFGDEVLENSFFRISYDPALCRWILNNFNPLQM